MRHRPVRVLPADWEQVREFVLHAVMAYRPATERLALELASTVALYVLWATKEKFAPLDKDDLFYPGLMNQFIRSRTNSAGSHQTLHSRLFRLAEAVSGTEHRPSRYINGGRYTKLVDPYTPRELAELENWARTQDRPAKRRHAHIVLGLMGGAGLWTGEALSIRGEDLARTDSGWTVHVTKGENQRAVPVRDDWSYYLDEYADTYVAGEYVLFPNGTEGGISNGVGGAPLADDRYMCPSTPTELMEAGKDYDEGTITEEQLWDRLHKREDYELHRHDGAKDGSKMRFSCPALGPSPTVDCPLRKLHAAAKPSEEADRPQIHKRDMPERVAEYKVCCQNTITVKSSDNVKNRQKLRWQSKKWFRTYRVDRNSMESLNDIVKDDIQLDKSSNRPMRGMAAQQFAFALLMVATNMKRIIEFEHQLHILDKRTREGRPPRKRKQKHELLERRRDRLGRSNYKRNPDPVKLVPMPRT